MKRREKALSNEGTQGQPAGADDTNSVQDSPSGPETTGAPAKPSPRKPDNFITEGTPKKNRVPPESTAPETAETSAPAEDTRPNFTLQPRILVFIGRRLSQFTGIDDYKITREDAEDIAFCVDDICDRRGLKIASEINLLILLGLWLGFPTAEFMKRKKAEDAKAGKKLGFWDRLLGRAPPEPEHTGHVPAVPPPQPPGGVAPTQQPEAGRDFMPPRALLLGPVQQTTIPAVSIQPQAEVEPGCNMVMQGEIGDLHQVSGPEVTNAQHQPIVVSD